MSPGNRSDRETARRWPDALPLPLPLPLLLSMLLLLPYPLLFRRDEWAAAAGGWRRSLVFPAEWNRLRRGLANADGDGRKGLLLLLLLRLLLLLSLLLFVFVCRPCVD